MKLLAAVVVLVGCACGTPCRGIDVKPMALECATSSTFVGEIHFDDAATFSSFLVDECLTDSEDADRQAFVDSVDFTRDAVFVASGLRQPTGTTRCISDRKEDNVQVCDDGLRVAFADKLSDNSVCSGKWTVAFSLPRSELRAALDTPIGQ